MNKVTLSVALATYNEEKFIGQCLDAVKDIADEIVVADGQSTDNTVKIIKKYKQARVISTTNKPIFHINKQMAIDACKSDWILQLDADEIVSPALKKEIIAIISSNPAENGFWLNRANYFLGRFLKKGGQYPDPTLRLYRRGQGRLPCKSVHEQAVVQGSVGHLQHDLLHYADFSFSRYLKRNNLYTGLIAAELSNPNFLNYFLFKPIHWFLLTYFRHKGFVDGFPGFVFSWYSSLRFPIAYIKYWESKHVKN